MNINRLKGRDPEDSSLKVLREEHALNVITREAPDRLRQVVRPEGEEVSFLSEVLSGHGRTGQFDHRADRHTRQVDATRLLHFSDDRFALFTDELELADRADEGNHDLRLRVKALLDEVGGGLAQGTHLQGEEAGQVDAETNTAQAKHRVLLVEATNLHEHAFIGRIHLAGGLGDCDLDFELGQGRHELVERRGDEADRHGLAVHDLEHFEEVLPLQLLKFSESSCALIRAGSGEDRALDEGTTRTEEHVLSTAQADSFGTEFDGAA